MKITNKYGLPQALVRACEGEHTGADYSVTELLKGVCEIVLNHEYGYKMEMDVSDSVNALFGTAVHNLLAEKSDNPLILSEHYMEDTFLDGVTVSGTADIINICEQIIEDYKTCSVWKVKFSDYEDWREQIKCYLYLWYVKTSMIWTRGRVVAIIKDFSQTDAERDAEYPRSPIVAINFEYTPEEVLEVRGKWHDKLAQIEDILRGNKELEEPCTEKERWAKPAKFAVMKKGRKSAIKLFDDKESAEVLAEDLGKGYSVEERKGEDTKCKKYCVAGKNGFCPYYNEVYGGEK